MFIMQRIVSFLTQSVVKRHRHLNYRPIEMCESIVPILFACVDSLEDDKKNIHEKRSNINITILLLNQLP